MNQVRTEVTISGLLKSEVDEGIADLRKEFANRPWLLNAKTSWEGDLFVVTVDREGSDSKVAGLATIDEVWDCIIACLAYSTDLHFEVRRSERIQQHSDTISN